MLKLSRIQLKHFRCFDEKVIELNAPIVLIEGLNGAGKTSLLEALYYACYLRSFRTHLPRELVQFGHDNFFIKVYLENDAVNHQVQVGFSQGKRLVKVDQKSVSSYKELLNYYRIVSLTEDDLQLIQSSPQMRRTFIDQVILLHNPGFLESIKELKHVVNARNSLLRSGNPAKDTYMIWTEQLWEKSLIVQEQRKTMLMELEKETNRLLHDHIDADLCISLSYVTKKTDTIQKVDDFLNSNAFYESELKFNRSLFGAHLDDILIKFQNKKSKAFASRGQQKLIILLLKIAQIRILSSQRGPSVFLLDDFITDFDDIKINKLITLLATLNNQLIFTSPAEKGALSKVLSGHGAMHSKLTY